MANFSRTVNTLHFEDLEPHQFEDLVRQLAYDFRNWHSIEATGRLGTYVGVYIRATERVRSVHPSPDQTEEADNDLSAYQEHPWLIQCKREKRIGPKNITEIFAAAINDGHPTVPHGFII